MARINFESHFENLMEVLFLMKHSIGKAEICRILDVSLRTADRYVSFLQKHFTIDDVMSNGEKRFTWTRRKVSGGKYLDKEIEFKQTILKIAHSRGHEIPSGASWIDW